MWYVRRFRSEGGASEGLGRCYQVPYPDACRRARRVSNPEDRLSNPI